MSCPDCVTGSIHSGTPKGTETKVGGIKVYAVGDENSKRVIIAGVDMFGWRFVNVRLLADEYAAKGFRVYIPDLFDGWELPTWTLNAVDPVNTGKSFFQKFVLIPASLFVVVPWMLRNFPRQVSIISAVTAGVREAQPDAKVGFVGYCWGGHFAIKMNDSFDATVACHPSLVSLPSALDNIKKPISFAAAETDHAFDKAKAEETEKILRERGMTDVETVVYEGVQHGFTSRGNMADETQKAARDGAAAQVIAWFEKYLS